MNRLFAVGASNPGTRTSFFCLVTHCISFPDICLNCISQTTQFGTGNIGSVMTSNVVTDTIIAVGSGRVVCICRNSVSDALFFGYCYNL
jgi:hypothetical protein